LGLKEEIGLSDCFFNGLPANLSIQDWVCFVIRGFFRQSHRSFRRLPRGNDGIDRYYSSLTGGIDRAGSSK
jgi:hypothetical protein